MAALERRCGMLFEEQYTTGRGLIEMPDKSVVKGGLEEMPVGLCSARQYFAQRN